MLFSFKFKICASKSMNRKEVSNVDPLTSKEAKDSDSDDPLFDDVDPLTSKEAEDGDGDDPLFHNVDPLASKKSEDGDSHDPLFHNVDPLTSKKAEDGDSDDPLFDDDIPVKEVAKSNEDGDLSIGVTDPFKQVHTMETFVSYKVTTNTSRSSFDSSQYVVNRRYQDFVWLKDKLEEEYPTYILPPLPSKFIVKGLMDRFSNEFTETRCRALNKFLQNLAKHPVVSFSDHLKTFITSENFSATGKQGLLARMSGSLKWSSANNPEFEPVNEYVGLLGEKLGAADRVTERLVAEKKELLNEMSEYAPTFEEWGEIEKDPTESIMLSISDCIQQCNSEVEKNLKTSEQDTAPALKEYILYAENIKQVLKRRDQFQNQFEKVDGELKAKKEEKENLKNPEQSRSISSFMSKTSEQKEEKINQQIMELSNQREKLNDDLAKANANFQVDYDRWSKEKLKDNVAMLSNFASAQISYHDNCLSAWEQILPKMKGPVNS